MISVSAAAAYELWAESYDRDPNALLALEARVLWSDVAAASPRRTADIGCGTGRWLEQLSRSGVEVIGVDASPRMLARAAQKPDLQGRLILARADELPIADAWADLTLCSLSLAYFPNLGATFGEFARITRPGASVIVSDLHPEAVAAGWSRSFRADGNVYSIVTHAHSPSSVRDAAAHAGLTHCADLSVHFEAPEYELFRRSGKKYLFEKVSATPALLVSKWRRPC